MSNQATSTSNSQGSNTKSTINTTALAYLGEIRQVPAKEGRPAAYYVNASLLAGNDGSGKKRYQYMSLRVCKQLVPAIEQAFSNQTVEQGKTAVNTLSNLLFKISIFGSFFSDWNNQGKSGVNGDGVLMSYDVLTSNSDS